MFPPGVPHPCPGEFAFCRFRVTTQGTDKRWLGLADGCGKYLAWESWGNGSKLGCLRFVLDVLYAEYLIPLDSYTSKFLVRTPHIYCTNRLVDSRGPGGWQQGAGVLLDDCGKYQLQSRRR